MREQLIKEINERLCAIEKSVVTLTKQHANEVRLTKELKKIIMANHETELAKIGEIKDQVISVGQQIVASLGTLRDKITALEAQVAAGSDTSDIQAALAGLKVAVQSTDDLVDDLPVTIPPTP